MRSCQPHSPINGNTYNYNESTILITAHHHIYTIIENIHTYTYIIVYQGDSFLRSWNAYNFQSNLYICGEGANNAPCTHKRLYFILLFTYKFINNAKYRPRTQHIHSPTYTGSIRHYMLCGAAHCTGRIETRYICTLSWI